MATTRDDPPGGAGPAEGRGSWTDTPRLTENSPRETWLCRSTIGAASDVVDDFEGSDGGDGEDATPAHHRDGHGDSDARPQVRDVAATEIKASSTRARKLTLGSHLDVARAHALRKFLPPLTPAGVATLNPTPLTAGEDKIKRKHKPLFHSDGSVASKRDSRGNKTKDKRDGGGDAHLMIYMDYEREPGFGSSPKRREVFVVRHVGGVYVVLFLSTACMHCVSLNVSPALRWLFQIETLPVGVCMVVTWAILGLLNCLGAWLSCQADRVMLLRRFSLLWIVAVTVLQLAKIEPVTSWFANALIAVGFLAVITAHGLLVPTTIAVGADVVTAKAVATFHDHDDDSKLKRQQASKAAIGVFVTWGCGVILSASSLVQAFYFACVNMELAPGEGVLILRTRQTVAITIPCGTLLLAFLITFLFQSRHHYVRPNADASTTESSSSSLPSTPVGSSPSTAATQARNALERKLARGEFNRYSIQNSGLSRQPARMGLLHWLHLARRSFALLALGIFTLLLLAAVGAALVAQTITNQSSSIPDLVHLVIFAVISAGWVVTMLLGTSQLGPSPRDKLYGHLDDMMVVRVLPSRHQLFVLVALVCLGGAVALAAFVRAQLYSTLFVQTCQLRRPRDAAILYDPNLIGAWVGLASVVLLPVIHFALHRTMNGSPRVSAVRRVAVGVLLYLVSIFLSSVVELYRRASRWPTDVAVATNPDVAGCSKTHPSNFNVLWSIPHLVVLAFADAVFRVGAAEEAHALTEPLDWLGVAQGVLSLADSVGYAAALTLTKTLSPWLFHVKTSDLVLLLLLITAIASLSYALTKQLADHVHASRCPRPIAHENDSSDDSGDERAVSEDNKDDDDEVVSAHKPSLGHDAAGWKETQRIAQDERDRAEASCRASASSVSSSRQRLNARALPIDRIGR